MNPINCSAGHKFTPRHIHEHRLTEDFSAQKLSLTGKNRSQKEKERCVGSCLNERELDQALTAVPLYQKFRKGHAMKREVRRGQCKRNGITGSTNSEVYLLLIGVSLGKPMPVGLSKPHTSGHHMCVWLDQPLTKNFKEYFLKISCPAHIVWYTGRDIKCQTVVF